MPPASTLKNILDELKRNSDVEHTTLVSRSGMHIAGEVPEDAHQETYVAMSAILLGSSETATSELHDELEYVLVELTNSRMLIQSCGPSSILVSKLSSKGEIDETLEKAYAAIESLKQAL